MYDLPYWNTIQDLFLNTSGEFKYKDSKAAEVGIEVECEAEGRLPGAMLSHWRFDADGSLQGNSAEYVLQAPVARDKTKGVLDYLQDQTRDSQLQDSNRTSVHIHVNYADIELLYVYNTICLYAIFENLLVQFCGEDRVGNLFCLRMQDCDALPRELRRGIMGMPQNGMRKRGPDYPENPIYGIATNDFRYAAVNVASLAKFGSLEFRSLRCPVTEDGQLDVDTIETWIGLLLHLKDASFMFANPAEIITEFSILGPIKFAHHVFGGAEQAIIIDEKADEDELWEGMRVAQDIAFATQWKPKEEAVKRKDKTPF